ncbi:MAG: hypothetical protein KBA31_19485 [Alphaproteobacteria bacterium]|nr:hypothetical protein [Alphaproteobacteria bacterium]
MIKSDYRFKVAPDLNRRTIFRAPEDMFADPNDVAQRHADDIRTPAIDSAIAHWNDAKQAGDSEGLRVAAKAIVDATSAAFRVQGVPTHAHPVLPPQFVKAEMKDVGSLPIEYQHGSMRVLLDSFDRSATPGAAQELASHLKAIRGQGLDGAMREPEGSPASRLGVPPSPAPLRRTYPMQALPTQQSPQPTRGTRETSSWWKWEDLLPPEEGGEDGFRSTPSPTGPFARPKSDKQPVPGFEYGAWEKKSDPRTSNGTLLVPPSRLTRRQQENLLNRNWIHPTGKPSGAGRLDEGYGYFGADRPGPGDTTVYHGAYDAPYKYPNDPEYDLQGQRKVYSRAVRLPTRATYLGFVSVTPNDPVYGQRTINMFRFSLGDGIILEMLHVEQSPAFLAKLAEAQRTGAPLQFDAGEILGEVDGDHDHTHIQIRVTEPNGESWVVDPTFFLEKKARTFLRVPMPDFIDDAIDWSVRQFE